MPPAKKKSAPRVKPVTFAPVPFKPQVMVRSNHDLSGWIDRRKRIKWSMSAGEVGYLDQDTARQFYAKGYVQILEGEIQPVSDMEREELMGQRTVLTMEVPNG